MSYATRRSREVPKHRPYEVYIKENHTEYCYGQRHEADWKDSDQFTRLSREREVCVRSLGRATWATRTRFRLPLAWVEDGQLAQEYDSHLKWKGQFLRYLIGWVTQDEENSFSTLCNNMFSDLTNKNQSQSYYLPVSKGLSGFLRHNKHKNLFSETGSVELSNVFAYMSNNPQTR